jgi:hypothetical protein
MSAATSASQCCSMWHTEAEAESTTYTHRTPRSSDGVAQHSRPARSQSRGHAKGSL